MPTLHFTLSTIFGYVSVLIFVSAQTYYITPNASNTPCSGDSVPCLNNPSGYVTPPSSNSTSNMPCPNVPCMTLMEYANQLTRMYQAPSSKITIVFLPGAHHLGSDLHIQNIKNLILHVAPTNTSSPVVAMVTCVPSSGFIFEDITGVSVSGLEFSGCEGNTVRSVDQLTIEDCTFRDGGHLRLTSIGNGSVLRSSFNSLRGIGRGGALYVGGIHSSVTIQGSSFTNNRATGTSERWWEEGGGGALYVEPEYYYSTVTIHSSSFTNDTAASYWAGGTIKTGLYHGFVTIRIHSSSFTNNTANWGGAIYSSGPDVAIIHSSFTNNTAYEDGGAIASLFGSDVTVHSSSFSNNTADQDGGAISSDDGDVTVHSSSFNNNTAFVAGGAIYSRGGGDVTIHSSSFSNNTAGLWGAAISSQEGGGYVTIHSSSFSYNTGGGGGAVSSINARNTSITSTEFIGNKAVGSAYYGIPGDGGAMRIGGGRANGGTVSNCTFINNTAERSGGALRVEQLRVMPIRDNTFKNNTAVRGGAVYAQSSTLIMSINDIAYNSAEQGGALYAQDGSEVKINMNSFENNTAHDGGAIYIQQNSRIEIYISTFSYHMVSNAGGAIYSRKDSNIAIRTSNFSHNVALKDGGGAIYLREDSHHTIHTSNFKNNTALDGGAIYSRQNSMIVIHDSTFLYQMVSNAGGAIYSREDGNITIHTSNFSHNVALKDGGGAIYSREDSHLKVQGSIFKNNTATYGGAIYSREDSTIAIHNSNFTNNTVRYGGTIYSRENSSVAIFESTFTHNTCTAGHTAGRGGAIHSREYSTIVIHMSWFAYNMAGRGGAIYSQEESVATVYVSNFTSNTAIHHGGAIYSWDGIDLTINSSIFAYNTAGNGGAVTTYYCNSNIYGSKFIGNKAARYNVFSYKAERAIDDSKRLGDGGAMSIGNTIGNVSNCTFSHNTAERSGGAMRVENSGRVAIRDSTFNNNTVGEKGGAIHVQSSTLTCSSLLEFTNNRVNHGTGGALSVEGSKIYSYGDTIIFAHNTALSGGGIYAYQSELNFNGSRANIRNNTADMRGGGIYAVSSTTKLSGGVLQFKENTAERGGGMCLEQNAKLYVTKAEPECLRNESDCTTNYQNPDGWLKLQFTNNSADYGGALYVSDDTSAGTCSANTNQSISSECFFQALDLHSTQSAELNVRNTYFNGNSATISGGTIFGGLLDRCTVSPYAEIFNRHQNLSPSSLKVISYLTMSTNLQTRDSNIPLQTEISSEPVRVCFCNMNDQPDCNLRSQLIKAKKGQIFSVSLVAVDQVNNPVPSTVRATLSSHDGGLGDGQVKQDTTSNCKALSYSVTSPHINSEQLLLYADGPCKDTGISQTHINIEFIPCEYCPIGFNIEISSCICVCDPELTDYITSCSFANESVERKDNIWITYINTTEQEGYLNYTHCPFDYCKPSTDQVWINLNVPNGADAQCAFNHSGKLCGSCEDGLSLSLGSSRCMSCSNNWLALLIVFAMAGVALVAFLLVCNLTVAVGTINGLIFYANILVTNRATFFPFETPNFFTVFIAWINLDFGFVTCFFDGMDGYSKTWLQLAFPLYIIFLVAMVIIACEYTTRLARLFTKTDPVATLATLILLSYTKSLRLIIAALSSATLEYPDGSNERLWLTDANIHYFEGKHIPLFLVALLILVLGIGYTFLLFFWQWLLPCSYRRALSWIRHARFYPFMDAYHAPYTLKHRYWTGILLFIRVIFYLTAALNVSGDPSINLLSISCVLVGLLVLDKLLPGKVYKTWTLNALENSFTFNLIIFSVGSLYVRETGGNQAALAYTSTSIAFITFLAILVYHTFTFVLPRNPTLKNKLNSIKLKLKCTDKEEEDDTPEVKQAPENKCTYSVVDGPKRHDILGKGDEKNELEPSSDSQVTTHNHSSPENELNTTNHTAIELQEIPAAHNRADSNDPPPSDSEFEAVAIKQGNEPPTQSRSPLDPYIDDFDIEQKGIERETEMHDFIKVTL